MTHRGGKILLVLGAGLGMYFSIGIVLIHGFGVFILPIAADTGWDRRSIAAVVAPVALVNGLMSPLVGILTDRFGPRLVLTVSSVTTGLGLAAIGLTSGSLAVFVAAVVLASILGGAQTGVPYTQVIVGWFDARRGLALGSMLAFVGLGIASIPPTLSGIIASWGWRPAFVAAGMVTTLVTLPIALFLIRDPPLRRTEAGAEGHSLHEALSTSSFWLMLGAFFMNYLVAAAGSISLPVVLADRGVPAGNAAVALSVVGAAFILARLGFGALLDRLPPVPLTSFVFLMPVAGHVLLAGSDGLIPAGIGATLFGLALGAEGDAMGYLLARRFGTRHFGKIFGINYFAFTLGAGLGPAAFHLMAGSGAGYTMAFTVFAILGTIAPLMLLLEWNRSNRRRVRTI